MPGPEVRHHIGHVKPRSAYGVSLREYETNDVLAETFLEESWTAASPFGVSAKVIFQAALLFRPLDSPPLQQMPRAESIVLGRRSPYIPAASSGANNHNSAQQPAVLVSEQKTASACFAPQPSKHVANVPTIFCGKLFFLSHIEVEPQPVIAVILVACYGDFDFLPFGSSNLVTRRLPEIAQQPIEARPQIQP